MQRIDAHHQRRAAHRGTDARNVFQLVGADEGVAAGLAFRLAQALQVDELAEAAQRIAALGKRWIVGDLDQLEHAHRDYRASAERRSALASQAAAKAAEAAAMAAAHWVASACGRPATSNSSCRASTTAPAAPSAGQGTQPCAAGRNARNSTSAIAAQSTSSQTMRVAPARLPASSSTTSAAAYASTAMRRRACAASAASAI